MSAALFFLALSTSTARRGAPSIFYLDNASPIHRTTVLLTPNNTTEVQDCCPIPDLIADGKGGMVRGRWARIIGIIKELLVKYIYRKMGSYS